MFLRLIFLLVAALPAWAADESFYLGTYTQGTTSQGIYRGRLDSATGRLGPLQMAARVQPDPTFLALSPDHHFLFAALSNELVSFHLEADGSLREINRQPSCGPNTCCVCPDRTGRQLFAVSYDAGKIGTWPVAADGHIGPATSVISMLGSGPNAGRQQSAHPHSVVVDPQNHFLYVCDLGADRIWIFPMGENGQLTSTPASVVTTPGSGPRHLAFSPDGALAYVANELGVSTSVYARNPGLGALTPVDSLPNVPDGWPQGTGSAEIAVDPSQKWLLVSTRLEDFLTVFRINATYKPPDSLHLDAPSAHPLQVQDHVPSPVKFPRSFAIDSTGKWVVVAGETDNRISVMHFDATDGQLTATGDYEKVDRPVCVLFAP